MPFSSKPNGLQKNLQKESQFNETPKSAGFTASQQETLQVLLGPLSIHPDAGMPVLLCMLVVVQS